MSQAFVKEGEEPMLNEVLPSVNGLIVYLTRQNNGIPVREIRQFEEDGILIYEMSNGLSYYKNDENQWQMQKLKKKQKKL